MTDLISRQAAIDALKEHRSIFCDNTPETFSALPYGEKCRVDEIDNAIATLVNIPSAQPEIFDQIRWERDTAIQQLADLGYGLGEKRKKGRWIADEGIAAWKCSYCGGLPLLDDYSQMQLTKYCPNCGAKMEVEHETD